MNRLFKGLLLSILISSSFSYSQSNFIKPFSGRVSFADALVGHAEDFPIKSNFFSIKTPQENGSSDNRSSNLTPIFYMHFYGGMGISILSSSEIESLLGDDFGIGIGLPNWSWGLISGYKNIVQIEFNNGISDHDFNNNSIRPDIPSEVIKMDYETTDWQLKFNPLFWNMEGNSAYFIIVGTGDVDWKDKNNDGFSGTHQIFGLEYAQFSKFVSWSVSFKRYGISFKKTILFNIPIDLKTEAADYILEFKIGFGYGI